MELSGCWHSLLRLTGTDTHFNIDLQSLHRALLLPWNKISSH